MRKPLIAANWKMNKLVGEAVETAEALKPLVADVSGVEVVLCPTFPALAAVGKALEGSNIAMGGQNCYLKEDGAFTGETSPQMLADVGCTWVIIGHSERRSLFAEGDEFLNAKLKYALGCGLKVMFCVGETLSEREGGDMEAVLTLQVTSGLAGLDEAQFDDLAIAYEPVWAIGTGKVASPEQAEAAHVLVRGLVQEQFGGTVASALRIQYGGSVKPENAVELMGQPNVDGALVGGAALDAVKFAAIVQAAG